MANSFTAESKQPSERLLYTADFAQLLAEDETPVEFTVTVTGTEDFDATESLEDAAVTCLIGGGTHKSSVKFTVLLETDIQQHEIDIEIPIRAL